MRKITTILKNILFPSLGGARGGCGGMVCHIFFILSFLHSFIFTSCSSDPMAEEPEVKQLPIAFSGSMTEEEVTRAYTPLSDYVTSFIVWAYKNDTYDAGTKAYSDLQMVFPGFTVKWKSNTASTSATNTSNWEYVLAEYPEQQIKYWDLSAKAYRFFGSAEMSADHGVWEQTTVAGDEVYTYTCQADATNAADAPYFTRLWFSTNDGNTPTRPYGKTVTLEFIKPFAEVRFLFTYADPKVNPLPLLEDPDFRPATPGDHIAVEGELKITYPLTGTGTKDTWVSTPDWDKYLTAFTQPSVTTPTPVDHWYKVLPIRNQDSYKLKVTVNGADKECMVPEDLLNWSPGYRYTYIFKVNDEGGVELESVKVGVTEWNIVEPVDHSLYNW